MTRSELTEMLLGLEIQVRFVSIAEAVALHDDSIGRVGGKPGVRDLALLESALHKPMQLCIYQREEDPVVLAAALADGVAQNHAFLDGNKRTAFLVCQRFLAKNNVPFDPDVAEAVEVFRRLAAHEIESGEFVVWIRSVSETPSFHPMPTPAP